MRILIYANQTFTPTHSSPADRTRPHVLLRKACSRREVYRKWQVRTLTGCADALGRMAKPPLRCDYPETRTGSTCEVQAGHRVACKGMVVTQ